MINVEKAIATAVKSGKVSFGSLNCTCPPLKSS